MITLMFPGWYQVDRTFYNPVEPMRWCKDKLGESDYYTWSLSDRGKFSFKDEKWAMMFALRWS
jgi:hypothetical protein